MAYINDLLKDHQPELRQFRSQVGDLLPKLKTDFHREDLCLFKYLVARDYNVDRAEEMLRRNLQWRETHGVDSVLKLKCPDQVVDAFPLSYCGKDKRGCPIVYHAIGKWRMKKTVKAGLVPECNILLRQFGEQAIAKFAQMSKDGNQYCQYYGIYDMEGFDYTQFMSLDVTRAVKDVLIDYLANYPEILSYIRIINAPKLFQLAWTVVEPLLTGRVMSKVAIYGTNKESWKPLLLEHIDPDNLPSACGGAMTSCLPYKVGDGLAVFPKHKVLPEDLLQGITVQAGQKHTVGFHLAEGDELAWNFKTENYDIGFQVDFSHSEEQQPFIDFCRVDSHKFLQKGLMICSKEGMYTLVFDNSYSKFKPKDLQFAVQKTKA